MSPPSDGAAANGSAEIFDIDDDNHYDKERGYKEIRDIIFGGVTALALRSVVSLGIPHILHGAGSLSAKQIANKLRSKSAIYSSNSEIVVNADALDGILAYLAGKHVFSVSGHSDQEDRRYSLNHISRWLVGNRDLCPILLLQTHEVSLAAWQHLHEVVMMEKNADDLCGAFEIAHKTTIFEYARVHPAYGSIIDNAMACSCKRVMQHMVKQYKGFNEVNSIVDVGGGVGVALKDIVSSYPHLFDRAINFDLPHVLAAAPQIPGVEHKTGDMFESIPPAQGVFIKNILIDWDDEDCTKILQNCYNMLMPRDGRIIVVEMTMPIPNNNQQKTKDDDPSTKLAHLANLTMLAYTKGGRTRTESQWKDLIATVGFIDIKIFYLHMTPMTIIEGWAKNITTSKFQ